MMNLGVKDKNVRKKLKLNQELNQRRKIQR